MQALFNYFQQKEIPSLTLCHPNKTKLYSLGLAYSIKNTLRYNALSEIEFEYPQSSDGGATIDPSYALLQGKMLVLVENVGYYIIHDATEDLSGSVPIKHVIGMSLESEMLSRRLTGFSITGEDAYFATVLQTVLNLIPSWTIGTIDASLLLLNRVFEINNSTIYNFLMNDMSKAFGCIFEFDTFNKTVSAISNVIPSANTNILLSFDNLVKNIQFKEITEEICTALYCYGGGDLDIRNVNPLGSNVIYNFTHFKTANWMSQELINVLTTWEGAVEMLQPTYILRLAELQTLSEEMIALQIDMTTLLGELQSDTVVRETKLHQTPPADTTIEDAAIAAHLISITSKGIDIENKQQAIDFKNSVLRKIVHSLTFTKKISYAMFKNDVASMTATLGEMLGSWTNIYNNNSTYPFFVPNLLATKTPTITAAIIDAELIGKTILTISTARLSSWTGPLSDAEKISLLVFINQEITLLDTLYSIFQSIIPNTSITVSIDEIIIRLRTYAQIFDPYTLIGVPYIYEGYAGTYYGTPQLTDAQYLELTSYIFENTYTNSNIIATESMSVSDVQSQSQQLYNQSLTVLAKTSVPRYEFTGEFLNFMAIKDFSSFISELDLGKVINIKKDDDTTIEAVLLEMSITYDDPTNFGMTFSNSFRLDNSGFIYSDILGAAAQLGSIAQPSGFTSGSIGGWTVGSINLGTPFAEISSRGYVSFGNSPPTTYGNNVGAWFGFMNAPKMSLYSNINNYLQWDGSKLLVKAENFTLDSLGNITATSATLSGDITALTGHIGGWVVGATSLTDVAGTVGMSSAVTGGDDIRFWAGNVIPTIASFSVTEAGVLTASSGTIGGCVLATTSIGSTTFVSGPLGSGWNISNTGTAEFQNAMIRGTLRTSVFEKDTISVVNGIVLISSGDVLAVNMTALDASTLTIKGETSFVANEVLRIKDGTDDEWMLVTSAASAPTYTVTRDLAGAYGTNANPVWKAGTTVASMGVGTGTKTGFITLDSSSSYSPFIDIYGRNSNTYSDYTLHARLGWLKGITDSSVGLATTDTWGLYSDNVYLKGTIVASSGTIGGWSITSTTIQNAGATVKLGSTGNLAFGTTPPTSATVGTGLWLDSTGMYGLASNVLQAKFDAVTGAITAGGSKFIADVNGARFIEDTGSSTSVSRLRTNIKDSGTEYLAGSHYSSWVGGTNICATVVMSYRATGHPWVKNQLILAAADTELSHDVRITLDAQTETIEINNNTTIAGTLTANTITAKQPWRNVKSYGVLPANSGATNTTNIATAIGALLDGDVLYFPAGIYNFADPGSGVAPVTITNKSITIRGDGVHVSILRFTGCHGIAVSIGSEFKYGAIRDISVETLTAGTYTAIKCTGAGAGNNMNFLLENVDVRPENAGTNSWAIGIELVDTRITKVVNCSAGGNISYMSYGIHIMPAAAGPVSCNVDIINFTCTLAQYAIRIDDAGAEGVHIINPLLYGVNYGISWLSPNGGNPDLQVDEGHIAAYISCIEIQNVPQSSITNVLCYKRSDSASDFVGIHVLNSESVRIVGCVVQNTGTGTVNQGIKLTSGSTECTIIGNVINTMTGGVAIWLEAGANYNSVIGNAGLSNSTTILDSGTGNDVAHNPMH